MSLFDVRMSAQQRLKILAPEDVSWRSNGGAANLREVLLPLWGHRYGRRQYVAIRRQLIDLRSLLLHLTLQSCDGRSLVSLGLQNRQAFRLRRVASIYSTIGSFAELLEADAKSTTDKVG